jgi:WD40 repeat protein
MAMPENDREPISQTGAIAAADLSPDGKTLVTAGLDGTLAEWDADTGKRRRVLLDPRSSEDRNPEVVMIKDGREVEPPFSISRLSESMRGSPLLSVRFSPDGRLFAVGAANGEVSLWNAASGCEIFIWRPHRADVVAIDISSNGKWLATGALGAGSPAFRIWRIRRYAVVTPPAFSDKRQTGDIWAVSFSHRGRWVAAGGGTSSQEASSRIYRGRSGETAQELGFGGIGSVRFSPRGRLLVAGDGSGVIRAWKVGRKNPLFEKGSHGGLVTALGFCPGGRLFCSGGMDGTVKVHTAREGRLIGGHSLGGRVLACRLDDDGRSLLAVTARPGSDRPEFHRLA